MKRQQEAPDLDLAIKAMSQSLQALGFPFGSDPEVEQTPTRLVEMLHQFLHEGFSDHPPKPFVTEYEGEDMVLIRDIPFYSLCAHHLLPFFGRADIAYIPGGKVMGISALPQVLGYFAKRPQLQERLAEEVAEYLQNLVEPSGVIVRLRARQMCMEMRGTKSPGIVEYAASRGELKQGDARREFFRRVKSSNLETGL